MYYNLFISHSWTYSDAYDKLLSLLRRYHEEIQLQRMIAQP